MKSCYSPRPRKPFWEGRIVPKWQTGGPQPWCRPCISLHIPLWLGYGPVCLDPIIRAIHPRNWEESRPFVPWWGWQTCWPWSWLWTRKSSETWLQPFSAVATDQSFQWQKIQRRTCPLSWVLWTGLPISVSTMEPTASLWLCFSPLSHLRRELYMPRDTPNNPATAFPGTQRKSHPSAKLATSPLSVAPEADPHPKYQPALWTKVLETVQST